MAVTVSGAAEAPVGLGTADRFAVLAGAGVTSTGPTVINGDLGSCPTPAVTGAPTVNGTVHQNDAVACQAQIDLTTAYNDAVGRTPTTTYAGPTDLGGMLLVPGVYNSPTSLAITGVLTLDGGGDPNAVFIFQAGSTLTTAVGSTVALINGAQACNVYWQVGSSATLGVGSTFAGTILALSSVTTNTGALVQGRLLARGGAVTLDSNTITRPLCAAATTTSSAPATTVSTTDTSTTLAPTTTSSTTTTVPTTSSTVSTSTSTSTTATTSTSSTTTSLAPSTTSSTTSTTLGLALRPLLTSTTSSTITTVPLTTTTASTTIPGRTTTTMRPSTTITTTRPPTITTVSTSTTGPVVTTGGAAGPDVPGSAPQEAKARAQATTGASVAGEVTVGGVAVALGALLILLATRRHRRVG